MIFSVITRFLKPETEDFPITKTLVAYDLSDAERFLREHKIKYLDICIQI